MTKAILLVAILVPASVLAADSTNRTWSVEEETRKMVRFEKGKEVEKIRETVADGPADCCYYGPGTREKMLAHRKATGRRTTWIENGVLYVDSEPCLRRGLYAPGYCCSTPLLERLKADDPGCDGVMSGVTMTPDHLVSGVEEREGKKPQKPSQAVFDAIDRKIESVRDKDFGYYYLNDEPECRGISPAYLRYMYQYIKEKDPYHLVLICSRDAARYMTSCDWIEVHPYLAPRIDGNGRRIWGTPISVFGNHLEAFVAANRPDKLIGCTPPAFGYTDSSYDQDVPTFDEYVACVWAELAEGARTIYPFLAAGLGTRPGIYEGVRYTFSSAVALQGYLLFGRRTRLEKNDNWTAVRWDRNGETLLAFVNFTTEKQKVSVSGLKGVFREFRGSRTLKVRADGTAHLTLAPLEALALLTSPAGENLPTTAAVREKVAKLEYERTHRDNQLFNRAREFSFAASKSLGLQSGICNGMLEDQSEAFRGDKSWYEIGFPAGAIEFDRVLVHGANLNKTTLKIRRDGKWIEPIGLVRTVDPRCVTFSVPKPLRTIKLRFEFHRDKVELYEIEVPHVPGGRPLPSPADCMAGTAKRDWRLPNQDCLVFDASNADYTNQWSGSLWYGDSSVTVDDDGTFSFGDRPATRSIRFNPKWRWLDCEIPRKPLVTVERGYSSWGLSFLKNPCRQSGLCGDVLIPQEGRYTIPLVPVPADKKYYGYLQVGQINMSVPFSYIRLSEEPPTRFSVAASTTNAVLTAGDRLCFSLVLEDPCEEVDVSYTVNRPSPQPFQINWSSSMVLMRQDERGFRWGGELVIGRVPRSGRNIRMKAVCLGGKRPQIVVTVLPKEIAACEVPKK